MTFVWSFFGGEGVILYHSLLIVKADFCFGTSMPYFSLQWAICRYFILVLISVLAIPDNPVVLEAFAV